MSIYTRKGDRGITSLGNGVKVPKDSVRVEAYGSIDELNALIGVINAELSDSRRRYRNYLVHLNLQIQDDLFSIGSYLSNPANADYISKLDDQIYIFELKIDEMTSKMPELNNFILPGGVKSAAYFQNARTVARRAERNIVKLARKNKVNENVVKYVNRLSDLLFTMSRYVNYNEQVKETIWKRR